MTPREQSGTGAPAKRDHRQEVTDSIIKMLEQYGLDVDRSWRRGPSIYPQSSAICFPNIPQATRRIC